VSEQGSKAPVRRHCWRRYEAARDATRRWTRSARGSTAPRTFWRGYCTATYITRRSRLSPREDSAGNARPGIVL